MDAAQLAAAIKDLTTEQVCALCSGKSGRHWQAVVSAFQDAGVDGDALSDFVETVDALKGYLCDELGLDVPKAIARQLRKILERYAVDGGGGPAAAAAPPPIPRNHDAAAVAAGPGGGGGGGGGGGHKAAVTVLTSVPAAAIADPQVALRVSVHNVAADNAGGTTNVTLDVIASAPVPLVKRRLLQKMSKPLTTGVTLTHAGRQIVAGAPHVEWSVLSIVHAAVRGESSAPLTIDNAAHHPLAAGNVVLDKDGRGGGAHRSSLTLQVHDAGVPMGNGVFGAVFNGTVIDGRLKMPVAVKKFFMLENPMLYGFADAAAVEEWANRDLLPEVNVLAGLAHKNVVQLRCVGLGTVHGLTVPAYVAMDLCTGGTLESWMRDGKLTNAHVVPFLCDLIDGMAYLHHVKRLVHRDLKPDNLFVQLGHTTGRPVLVVGDVGLAKQVMRTMSLVSAAGAVAYRAPEAMVDISHCSSASDVFTASLVAVELVTGRQVYQTCQSDAAAKQALVQTAKTKVIALLHFAEDSPLSVAAANNLLDACTVVDPGARPSFKSMVGKYKRQPDGAQVDEEMQRLRAALEEQRVAARQAEERATREREARELAEAQAAQQQAAAVEAQRIAAREEAEACEVRERQAREARERQARERNQQALARCTLCCAATAPPPPPPLTTCLPPNSRELIALIVSGSVAVDWNPDAPGNDGAETWREAYWW